MESLKKAYNQHQELNSSFHLDSSKAPMLLFKQLHQEAHLANSAATNVMMIATVTPDLQPSSRIVYLREILEEGFTFYTNYTSKKGKSLAENEKCSLLFFWQELDIQIRVETSCKKLESVFSDDYFASRPRANQINSWASKQSEDLESPQQLSDQIAFYENIFHQKPVPRPENWGGYLLEPHYFEFWKGQLGRTHERLVYLKSEETWSTKYIFP